MTEAEILRRYSEAEYNSVVESRQWIMGMLEMETETGDVVLYLNNKHIYGIRLGWLREQLFDSGRILAVWQGLSGAGLLIGPQRTEEVTFIFDDLLRKFIGIRGPWDVSFTNIYSRPLRALNPFDRMDYEFYNPEYDRDDEVLADCPTIADVADVSYGYHANPKKDEAVLKDRGGVVEQMPFLAISNLSPHGYVIGELERKPVVFLPKSSIVREGNLVVSLFGGNLEKKTIGSIGKVAILDGEHSPCFISQIMCSLKIKDGYDAHFVLLSIRSEYFVRQLRRKMRPANKTQTLITLDDFRECRIKEPSKAVMKKLGERYRKLMDSFKEEQDMIDEVEKL
jgi:hypothetical protein